MSEAHYDLIIVGGGLVGAGLAHALRNSDLTIALIDARVPSNTDPRLFGLTASSCRFLENLGIWDELAATAAPIHQVHVSTKGSFGAVRLDREDVQLPALGHVIPAYKIETILNERLTSQKNLTLYQPAQLQSITQDKDGVTVEVESINSQRGRNPALKTLRANFLIGADGADSTVRTQLNIETEIVDYQQQAIVTRTQLQRSHHQIAYERFNRHGAIAMLPLVENECATIWTVDNIQAQELKALSDTDFLCALQKEFGYRIGRMLSVGKRHAFPLRMVRAKQTIVDRVMLLGNSAHTLHPIAAQGFNLALYEVALLCEEFAAEVTSLQHVNEKIQSQLSTAIGVSHRLASLFTSKSRLLSCVLQFGMIGFDRVTPLKRKFLTKLIGKSGRVPDLLLSVNES